MSGRSQLLPHLRAAGFLLVVLWMSIQATPLLDTTVGDNYASSVDREAYRAEIGRPLSEVVITAALINRAWRDDLHAALEPLETPLLLRQYWNLYPIWGTAYRKLQVSVDGRVVHRSQDPEATWRNAVLRQHRVTYQLNHAFSGSRPLALEYALEWIVRQARADFPEATEVRVDWLAGTSPGRELGVGKRWVARAPDWTLVQEIP